MYIINLYIDLPEKDSLLSFKDKYFLIDDTFKGMQGFKLNYIKCFCIYYALNPILFIVIFPAWSHHG